MIVTTTSRMQAPAGTVLHVAGELDTFAADRLREHLDGLATAPSGAVVVDLSGVTFMSCTALRVLAEAGTRLGTRLFVGGRSRVVTRLLGITGLATHFADVEDDDPALGRALDLLVAVHDCTAQEAAGMLAGAAGIYGVPVQELARLLIRAQRDGDTAPGPAAAVATLALLMRLPDDPAEGARGNGCTSQRGRYRRVARLAGP